MEAVEGAVNAAELLGAPPALNLAPSALNLEQDEVGIPRYLTRSVHARLDDEDIEPS